MKTPPPGYAEIARPVYEGTDDSAGNQAKWQTEVERLNDRLDQLSAREELLSSDIESLHKTLKDTPADIICGSVTGFMTELHALAEIHQGITAEIGTLMESWSDEEDYERSDRHIALSPTLESLGTHAETIRNDEEALTTMWQTTKADVDDLGVAGRTLRSETETAMSAVEAMIAKVEDLQSKELALVRALLLRQMSDSARESPMEEESGWTLDVKDLIERLECAEPFKPRPVVYFSSSGEPPVPGSSSAA